MKPARIFQQYIWIVNTLRQYKKLSLEQLNELWVKDEVIGGEPVCKRNEAISQTFHPVRKEDLA